MLRTSDFIHLPFTRDLTEGGISYAVRSLAYTYNRMGGSPYERLRRIVAGVAVELAFRRYLAEHDVPFDVLGATPFTDPDQYDVSLGGRRCDIKSFLITYRKQITEMKRSPQLVLEAPALVPSDQHAGEGHTEHDLYLFAFLSGLVASSQADLQKVLAAGQPHYLIHALPATWARPRDWQPLGAVSLQSESEAPLVVELGGQDARREMWTFALALPPRTPVRVEADFNSLAYIHLQEPAEARLTLHSAGLQESHLISTTDWGNIWVYGLDILLAGYITREEFSRLARPIPPGTRVFQYERTRTRNLAVGVADLRPLPELFERVRDWARERHS